MNEIKNLEKAFGSGFFDKFQKKDSNSQNMVRVEEFMDDLNARHKAMQENTTTKLDKPVEDDNR